MITLVRLAVSCVALMPLVALAVEPALDGHCPVCLVEMDKLVPGSAKYTSTYDRQLYYFPSAKEKALFDTNPAKYVPALGGDCVVCRVHMGVRVPGKLEFRLVHRKRLYLFPSAKERDMFLAEPQKYERADVGLDGYCSVCVLSAKKWVAGNPEFVSVYDGVRYFFPSASEKKVFDVNPARYVPAFDGNCVVCFKNAGQRIAGKPNFSVIHQGRLYLFPGEAEKKMFLANPENYVAVDVANGGHCIVCARMGNERVPGSPEHVSVYKGMRYLFSSPREKSMFDANPAAYIQPDSRSGSAAADRSGVILVVGRTACAGCQYGVHPISDPNSLGIAVVSGETVYIVEGGESRYPDLFNSRFQGLRVELKGTVKKQDGKFVWVDPVSLKQSSD